MRTNSASWFAVENSAFCRNKIRSSNSIIAISLASESSVSESWNSVRRLKVLRRDRICVSEDFITFCEMALESRNSIILPTKSHKGVAPLRNQPIVSKTGTRLTFEYCVSALLWKPDNVRQCPVRLTNNHSIQWNRIIQMGQRIPQQICHEVNLMFLKTRRQPRRKLQINKFSLSQNIINQYRRDKFQ